MKVQWGFGRRVESLHLSREWDVQFEKAVVDDEYERDDYLFVKQAVRYEICE